MIYSGFPSTILTRNLNTLWSFFTEKRRSNDAIKIPTAMDRRYLSPELLILFFFAAIQPLVSSAAEKTTHYAFISPADAGKKFTSYTDTRALIKQADRILKMRPKALPTVHVEGVLDFKDAENMKDWPKTLSLALAYRLTNDARYLIKAQEYLVAWLDVFYLSLNTIPADSACMAYPLPNPGRQCVNPIDDTDLSIFVLAYDIVSGELPDEIKTKMFRFMRNMAISYLEDIEMRTARAEAQLEQRSNHYLFTNWHSHRIKLVVMAAFETGDAGLINRAVAAFKQQVAGNLVYPGNQTVYDSYLHNIPLATEQKSVLEKDLILLNNGSVYDFYQRNALHYVIYDLDPLLQAVLIAHANGFNENLYLYTAENGAQLARAVRWLQPFAEGTLVHNEFVNSSVSFDARRSKEGLKDYSGNWDPIKSKGIFMLAIIMDKSLMTESIRIKQLLNTPYTGEVYDPWFSHKFAGRELVNFFWSIVFININLLDSPSANAGELE